MSLLDVEIPEGKTPEEILGPIAGPYFIAGKAQGIDQIAMRNEMMDRLSKVDIDAQVVSNGSSRGDKLAYAPM